MSSKKLKNIETKHNGILKEILGIQQMLPGTFNEVYCKCGRKNCWCYKSDNGHPFRRIIWSEQGKQKIKSIPLKDVPWIKMATENYRTFRRKKRELKNVSEEMQKVLEEHAKIIIKKTRQKKGYK